MSTRSFDLTLKQYSDKVFDKVLQISPNTTVTRKGNIFPSIIISILKNSLPVISTHSRKVIPGNISGNKAPP